MRRVLNAKFKIDPGFISFYKSRPPHFGFNGLGEIAYRRSYSRIKEDGTKEQWFETVERVVNGTMNLLIKHSLEANLKVDLNQLQNIAQTMYGKIFDFKFMPPGRGLWAMGTKLTEAKQIYASLNNCAFVTTENCTDESLSKPFTFLMDMSMLGVGVGFDTKGASSVTIKTPNQHKDLFVIEDSREGWVSSVKKLLDSYFIKNKPTMEFDYSKLRPEGAQLKTFGGTCSGPEPLKVLHKEIRMVLDKLAGKGITTRAIVDIMNMIAKCVIAGNIRKTAEIAFGEPDDEEFLNLKNYRKYPERALYGWTSNNSVFAKLGMDYTRVCDNILYNGEPGFCWLENMRAYGRMLEPANYKDHRAAGGNPCLEQTLESYEMCCLVETFPNRHESYAEYEDTLKFAYLYAKIVTLGLSHWTETSEIVTRNRRIGCSMSGIAQFLGRHQLHTLKDWLIKGYDAVRAYDLDLSNKLKVNPSIKSTSIKPSGTVSLLAGATPGMHYPESLYYIRRIRFPKNNELYDLLLNSGYKVKEDVYSKNGMDMVVEIPVYVGENVRSIKEVSMKEQLEMAVFLQKYWADNQVSCTVQFDPKTEGHLLTKALDEYQYKLKGISFLPRFNPQDSTYKQLPYEEITKDKYLKLIKHIERMSTSKLTNKELYDPKSEEFCDNDICSI